VVAAALNKKRMTVRYRNAAMLYHVPLTTFAGLSILKHTALKALGVKVGHGVYGK